MVDLSSCYLHTLGEKETGLLAELRSRVPALLEQARQESEEAAALSKLTIWRVDLAEQSEASDIVLLKYIRAEELDVDKAAQRIVQTLVFRADCKIDQLAEAELPEHFQGHDFISGMDADGRPVMISRFGGMDIDKVFGDVEAFVRYRAQMMEIAIAMMTFKKGGAEDLCQVHDYQGVIGSMYKSEVKSGVTVTSKVFGEHYPEFKGKTMFVNFPAVFTKPFQAFAMLLPARTRAKFVVLGKDDHFALFEHIVPGLVPEGLGGLLREPRSKVTGPGIVAAIKVRAVEDVTMLEVKESVVVGWELRVCVNDVNYEIVFVHAEGNTEDVMEDDKHLKAEDGIASGELKLPGPGRLLCRFKNEKAWFKGRVCCCRASVLP